MRKKSLAGQIASERLYEDEVFAAKITDGLNEKQQEAMAELVNLAVDALAAGVGDRPEAELRRVIGEAIDGRDGIRAQLLRWKRDYILRAAPKQFLMDIFLDEVQVMENGKAGNADAQNVVEVNLVWPRPVVPVRSYAKALRLEDGQLVDFRQQPFTERQFFKEPVQGRFGITVEVSERQSPSAVQQFLDATLHNILTAAWPIPDEAAVFERAVRAGMIGGFQLRDRAPMDKVQLIAVGNAEITPGEVEKGSIHIPLVAPADIPNLRAPVQDRKRKPLLKAGEPNGHVILSYQFSS